MVQDISLKSVSLKTRSIAMFIAAKQVPLLGEMHKSNCHVKFSPVEDHNAL